MKRPSTLGERIRAMRKEKKLTAANLAAKVGLSQTAIAKYENEKSRPTLEKLEEIAFVLGSSPKYLLFGDGEEKRRDSFVAVVELAKRLMKDEELKELEKIIIEFISVKTKRNF